MFEKIDAIISATDSTRRAIKDQSRKFDPITRAAKKLEKLEELRLSTENEIKSLLSSAEHEQLVTIASVYVHAYYNVKRELTEIKKKYSDREARITDDNKHNKRITSRLRQKLTSASQYADSAKQARKKGAAILHTENHAMKKEVFGWLELNMKNFKSMDAAAEEIAGKVAPIKFRTARAWVSEWKKLRPASTL